VSGEEETGLSSPDPKRKKSAAHVGKASAGSARLAERFGDHSWGPQTKQYWNHCPVVETSEDRAQGGCEPQEYRPAINLK